MSENLIPRGREEPDEEQRLPPRRRRAKRRRPQVNRSRDGLGRVLSGDEPPPKARDANHKRKAKRPRPIELSMSPGDALVLHAGFIQRHVDFECRRLRMPEESSMALSYVNEKLAEDDYRRVRAFNGRSKFQTYITVVNARLILDYQRHILGRWRPVEAIKRRFGEPGRLLEELVVRDGLTFVEACEAIICQFPNVTKKELSLIYRELRAPQPRRVVNRETFDVPSSAPSPAENLVKRESETRWEELVDALKQALEQLSKEDRLIIWLKIVKKWNAKKIAKKLQLEARTLYPRIKRLKVSLRDQLLLKGFSDNEVRELFNRNREAG